MRARERKVSFFLLNGGLLFTWITADSRILLFIHRFFLQFKEKLSHISYQLEKTLACGNVKRDHRHSLLQQRAHSVYQCRRWIEIAQS